jgi:hypothetical protein
MGFHRYCRCVAFVVLGLLAAAPGSAQTPVNFDLFFESQEGDPIGDGETKTYTEADGTVSVTSSATTVNVRIAGPSFSFSWEATFSAPGGILPGVYNTARRSSFGSFGNGLSFSGSGGFCSNPTGRFVVLEAEYGPAGITRFAADFEQHCEDAAPGLFGAIRYNSTISSLSPFGGSYPVYDLTIPTPSHGTVTSTGGLNCGTAGAACAETFGAATSVNLTATPDSGYIFAGWTEDCRGGLSTVVHVNGPKRCGALFELAASPQPRTLVVFDSQAGDAAGGGKQNVYSLVNSRITAQMNGDGSAVTFTVVSVDATREVSWTVTASAPVGSVLTVGTYEGALQFSGQRPGLQVQFCGSSFGRFVVRELVRGPGATVLRAAVDVENHCSGADPGFFGAIRFNATDTSTSPFGGSYPVYRLTVTPAAGGTISGGGLLCGTGGSACELAPSTPTPVTISAVPDAGYVFAGWTGGSCLGASSTTVRINSIKLCSAVFEPLVTASPRSRAFFDYMPGAKSAGSPASQEALSALASQWTVFRSSQSGSTIEFQVASLSSSGFTSTHRLSFSAPQGQTLQTGVTYAATRYPFPSATPGMDVTGGCNRLTGRFVIRELSVLSNGTVERAAIDFEQHCNDIDPAVFGSVRYNSTLDAVPFNGDYPRYRFVVPRPVHGRVTGAGLDCGAASAQCQADFSGPTNISITAVASAGYEFGGWSGPCYGGETITFRVNTVRTCAPLFQTTAAVPRALLRMAGQPGDAILRGRTEVYSLPNSLWNVFVSSSGQQVSFDVYGLTDNGETRWGLTFRAPTGQTLAPGTYTNASGFSSGGLPTLQIFGGGSCSIAGSSFTIRHLVLGAQSKVMRAAIDFEAHCDTISSPAVLGTIEYVEASDASRLTLDKTSLSFTSTSSGNDIGQTTAPQQVRLSQTAGANVAWTVSSSESWLRVTPASGSGPATLTVSIQPVGLVGVATHTGTITVSAGTEALPPVTVNWTLLPEGGAAPFGSFDTPIAMTPDLTGAVALTGWALDDVEVTGVQIWRQSHPADPPVVVFQGPGPRNGKVFVGDATLVDGARPDVEALYNLPNRSRAGWGYMLLTRGLIWDGSGLFTVHAIATDRDGHLTEIGSTAFSINNALATKPFGTIDTPGQGVTVSGRYANTGWVLTPNSGASIAPGNVRVVIDGAFVAGVPSVAAREDITAFFPTFDASQAGRGLFIDTTAFADGVHTIAWLAIDSTGQAEGIGSRYFRVANGGAGAVVAAARAAARPVPGASAAAVDEAVQAMSPILVRRGFDPAAPFDVVYGSSDPYAVDFEELDRIEVRIPEATGGRATAYLRAMRELRPLPAGASFDAARGVFTWQPGAGYIGRYDIVVVVQDRQGTPVRYEVQVTLQPRRK